MTSKVKETKPFLIIDANVLIRNSNLQELVLKYDLFTVPGVMAEIRDPTARGRLLTIVNSLKVETADKASCAKGSRLI